MAFELTGEARDAPYGGRRIGGAPPGAKQNPDGSWSWLEGEEKKSTEKPAAAPKGGGEGDAAAMLQGLKQAVQGPEAGFQRSGFAAGQADLGTRTPSMAIDALRQIVARRGRAY